LPTAAPSILRRLFAKLQLAEHSAAASHSTDPVSVPTAPPRSALTEPQPLSTVPLRSGPPAESKSVPTTAHPSIPYEADNNPDDIEALLKSAIEMARGLGPSQMPIDHGARTPAALASSMRAKRLRTSRIVQIQRDPQETAFLARDTKSGLVVMRHEDSKRLKVLCDWFGWQVIDGGMPGAGD
jgi:hypothetical protein